MPSHCQSRLNKKFKFSVSIMLFSKQIVPNLRLQCVYLEAKTSMKFLFGSSGNVPSFATLSSQQSTPVSTTRKAGRIVTLCMFYF